MRLPKTPTPWPHEPGDWHVGLARSRPVRDHDARHAASHDAAAPTLTTAACSPKNPGRTRRVSSPARFPAIPPPAVSALGISRTIARLAGHARSVVIQTTARSAERALGLQHRAPPLGAVSGRRRFPPNPHLVRRPRHRGSHRMTQGVSSTARARSPRTARTIGRPRPSSEELDNDRLRVARVTGVVVTLAARRACNG
jgi:hypothetical protein